MSDCDPKNRPKSDIFLGSVAQAFYEAGRVDGLSQAGVLARR
jgi:hypothetical protein